MVLFFVQRCDCDKSCINCFSNKKLHPQPHEGKILACYPQNNILHIHYLTVLFCNKKTLLRIHFEKVFNLKCNYADN